MHSTSFTFILTWPVANPGCPRGWNVSLRRIPRMDGCKGQISTDKFALDLGSTHWERRKVTEPHFPGFSWKSDLKSLNKRYDVFSLKRDDVVMTFRADACSSKVISWWSPQLLRNPERFRQVDKRCLQTQKRSETIAGCKKKQLVWLIFKPMTMCPLVCYIQARECRARFPPSNSANVNVRKNIPMSLRFQADIQSPSRDDRHHKWLSWARRSPPEHDLWQAPALFTKVEVFDSRGFPGFPRKRSISVSIIPIPSAQILKPHPPPSDSETFCNPSPRLKKQCQRGKKK